jgi:chemotaxis protein CheZ
MTDDPNLSAPNGAEYLEKVIASLNAVDRPGKATLVTVLSHLARYVENTKREIAALGRSGPDENMFSTVSVELEEVTAEAAHATGEIMNCAEAIDAACNDLSPEAAGPIRDHVIKIFESCAFQDITGQRVAKVISTVQRIEKQVEALAAACGGAAEAGDLDEPQAPVGDSALLHGPQLSGKANTQDEIDRIFEGS